MIKRKSTAGRLAQAIYEARMAATDAEGFDRRFPKVAYGDVPSLWVTAALSALEHLEREYGLTLTDDGGHIHFAPDQRVTTTRDRAGDCCLIIQFAAPATTPTLRCVAEATGTGCPYAVTPGLRVCRMHAEEYGFDPDSDRRVEPGATQPPTHADTSRPVRVHPGDPNRAPLLKPGRMATWCDSCDFYCEAYHVDARTVMDFGHGHVGLYPNHKVTLTTRNEETREQVQL